MAFNPTFLVVEYHEDNLALLARTLRRKFPTCVCIECTDLESALKTAAKIPLSAAIVHKAEDADGLFVVDALRGALPAVPIVYLSSVERQKEAKAAGATAFLLYDQWLRLGTLVGDLLGVEVSDSAPGFSVDPKAPRS